jgi:hypothetical protein
MQSFSADMGQWYEKLVQDGDKNEFISPIQFSGAQEPYGTVKT